MVFAAVHHGDGRHSRDYIIWKRSLMIEVDIRNAYRVVPIHPETGGLLG